MVLHAPARWEDDEVSDGHSRFGAGTSEHSKDGGILQQIMTSHDISD